MKWDQHRAFLVGPFFLILVVLGLVLVGRAEAQNESESRFWKFGGNTTIFEFEKSTTYRPSQDTYKKEVAEQRAAQACLPDCSATRSDSSSWRLGPYGRAHTSGELPSSVEASQ